MKSFPELYHKSKTGAIEVWKVWADGPHVYTEYGQLDGKMQQSKKEVAAVNIGKANERGVAVQAEAIAQSMWQHKLDRKYSQSINEAKEPLLLPMLAHKFGDGEIEKYPVHVQPKLDGVRCLAFWDSGRIELLSRSGKPYNVPHVAEIVSKFLPKDAMFDGELYVHGMTLQNTISLVKRNRPESTKVKYWVYDFPSEGTWEERFKELCKVFKKAPDNHGRITKTVKTDEAHSDTDVWDWMKKYNERGFEGAIVRLLDGAYEFGYRSDSLLKVKKFQDSEYEVIGAEHGVGKFQNCAVFVCRTSEGKEFRVTPKATQEERERFLTEHASYIGKMYTVRFFDLTDDGVPRFPVGIVFRDEADLPAKNEPKQKAPKPAPAGKAKRKKYEDEAPAIIFE